MFVNFLELHSTHAFKLGKEIPKQIVALTSLSRFLRQLKSGSSTLTLYGHSIVKRSQCGNVIKKKNVRAVEACRAMPSVCRHFP